MTDGEWHTGSGIEVRPFYGPEAPGQPPYTRGIHAGMYRDRLWTMRQYSGFGSPAAANARFRYLLAAGQTGLSCAFDLPTQMGYDSDHPRAEGEVGRVGVAVSTLDDMRRLLDGVPLERVTMSMTINATAAVLLLLYALVAEERGVAPEALGGTVQNDPLKEYVARGTWVHPPASSMRLVTDLLAWSERHMPRWNPISVSGYHLREAGATAIQELAFTMAHGVAYVRAAVAAGLDADRVGARLSFFFGAHNDLFEEVAKFRAARRMWHRLMTDRFGATDARATMLRFHAQTCGSTLTAQQPELNVGRVTLQALSAVMGGTQSLHTNAYDEALGLPSERSARIALRTQQVLAHESGVSATADPLGGSWFVESLTDAVEAAAWRHIEAIDALGGAVAAVETGYEQAEIEAAAYAHARAVDAGTRTVVGVNRFGDDVDALPAPEPFPVDPALADDRKARLAAWRGSRGDAAVSTVLAEVEAAAAGTDNVLEPMGEALRRGATLGEVSDALRRVLGVHRPG
ncbi:MAG TPA: methylmalonyl-CoA mutase family protein [Acidimicrobiales bacterium]|nr:methylmalonyl-CoA mutase family protein [Acidimicrobiales bacterium]